MEAHDIPATASETVTGITQLAGMSMPAIYSRCRSSQGDGSTEWYVADFVDYFRLLRRSAPRWVDVPFNQPSVCLM